MAENRRFDVRLSPEALKEYESLDNSVLDIVNNAIDDLEVRADEVGKPLGNNANTKLAGCKEKKLRDAGIRIVYRITNETVDVLRIVYILTIEKRSNDFVFKVADNRNKTFKKFSNEQRIKHLTKCDNWPNINKNK